MFSSLQSKICNQHHISETSTIDITLSPTKVHSNLHYIAPESQLGLNHQHYHCQTSSDQITGDEPSEENMRNCTNFYKYT